MKKILLTSAGFDNINIANRTVELIKSNVQDAKVLFVISAAVSEEQKRILPLCKREIIELGISEENIDVYDFEYKIGNSKIKDYDLIYVAGGSTKQLLEKFDLEKLSISKFLDNGGLYVGVSAGSIAMTSTYANGLNYLNCTLKVHQISGSNNGNIDSKRTAPILLTDDQAVLILDSTVQIIS